MRLLGTNMNICLRRAAADYGELISAELYVVPEIATYSPCQCKESESIAELYSSSRELSVQLDAKHP